MALEEGEHLGHLHIKHFDLSIVQANSQKLALRIKCKAANWILAPRYELVEFARWKLKAVDGVVV